MKKILFVFFALNSLLLSAQTLNHPVIYITTEERPHILEKIEKYEWAKSMKNQLHVMVDSKLASHQTDPEAILNTIAECATKDSYSESQASALSGSHFTVLSLAANSGILYYLTEDEKYAQFSADILAHYFKELAPRTPETTSICGNYFYDPRTTYMHMALAYDFIYNFLKIEDAKVYDQASKTYVAYDHIQAQKALANVAGNALKESGGADTHGKFISNHPILTAPGALFPILCIEDDTERERLLDVFWNSGTKRQNSFKNTILPMFGEQGIWPESTSYSFMPNISLILNVVDRIKPEMNVVANNLNIFEGAFLFENLRYPDRAFARYGDSHPLTDATDKKYANVLHLAKRRGYTELQKKAEIALGQLFVAKGGRKPTMSGSRFDNVQALELFWGEDVPLNSVEKFDYKPTVIVKHAGVVLQRNYTTNDNEKYGLCGVIGGAHYVHSHCTGIAMELYGAGCTMAPSGGLPNSVSERKLPVHTNYFRLYAGNNTVIVNGTSHGKQPGSWNSNAYLWQNTTVNIASEPKHLEDPISTEFSFSTQFLDDNVNNCDQQRTLSTIRTSPTTAYYFDIFRSKSLATNKFHDYIYHNIGDKTQMLTADNVAISLSATTRYNSDIGDPVLSPGWRFFEDTKVSEAIDMGANIRFDVEENDRYMHMKTPSGISYEYAQALGPPSRDALKGYEDKKTQIVAIRKNGEAWNQPFVAVFEPSFSKTGSIQSVESMEVDGKVIGAVVTSIVDGKEIKDYIISLDKEGSVYIPEHFIWFKGRFGIVRKEPQTKDTEEVTLYIGEGSRLKYAGIEVLGSAGKKHVQTFYGVPKTDADVRFSIKASMLGGEGSISISPDQDTYEPGSEIVVKADPEWGYILDEWLGDAVGTENTDTILVFSDKNVIAKFRPADFYTLKINSENGIVNQSETGRDFPEQSCIELTAVPNDGYVFESWSGDVVSRNDSITVCINSNIDIKANFVIETSISETYADAIILSPNPTLGLFTVYVSEPSTYFLYNIVGDLIHSGVSKGSFSIDISPLESSIYILKISTKKGIVNKRIFKS